jgi:hypothetical protein
VLGTYPRIYPICCQLALGLGPEEQSKIAQTLCNIQINAQFKECVISDSLWPLWPALLLCKLDKSQRIFIYGFLLKMIEPDPDLVKLDLLLTIFDIIACHLNDSIEQINRSFLRRAVSKFIESSGPTFRIGIILRCLRALLLHVNAPSALTAEFANSPFRNKAPTKVAHEDPGPLCVNQLISALSGQRRSYQFGVKVKSNGNLLHRPLFCLCLDFMKSVPISNDLIFHWK